MSPRSPTNPARADAKSAPGNFLDTMVKTVEEELRAGLYARRPPRGDEPPPGRPRFAEALHRVSEGPALMVELKHASPGRSQPRLPALSPERFVRVCEDAGISALSVIPQPYEFGGNLEEFGKVAHLSRLPLLFKDFIIDEAQIQAAKVHGASAVLLLARLARAQSLHGNLEGLVKAAHARGLETLVEVHAKAEVPLALSSGTDALGVNARDLGTLHLDPRSALPVLRELRKDPRPLVAMSGVEGPREVALYGASGADAILIGTAFARSHDPLAFLRGLRAEPPRNEAAVGDR
ncbi:MAG: indole-3-glycerol-phosphate synthase [Euryarchaeota archaeon]|nr:indole-3-glycerol-phosphate synthase [Euryarchaeota archaeon]MDE1837103.1 indole-3-glycerol-phosphate synthase [Euryarchaeota archaeon]MDE1879685.1 indole-3-glycerol-phosphate synthase [Euryarchaeota archaeon]MDE2045211.1 indole-3-glycerol-phosphate synthase [Thermoplasmata archaeon]